MSEHGPAGRWQRWKDSVRACWTIPGASDDLRQRLLNLQARSIAVNAWLGELVVLAVALAVSLVDPDRPAWWPLWVASIALSNVLMHRRRQRSMASSHEADYALWLGMLDRFVLACLFGGGLAWLFTQRGDELRLLTMSALIAVLCGGAMRYARLPLVAITWIVTLVALGSAALIEVGRPSDLVGMASMIGYGAVMISIVLGISRQFVLSCQGEFEAERQTATIELLLSDVEGASRDWFWECDRAGRVVHASPRLAEALGLPGHRLGKQGLSTWLARAGAQPDALADLRRLLDTERPFRDLVVPLAPAGSVRQWWSLSAKPLRDGSGRWTGWRGVGVDISEARRHEHRLRLQATTDALTGLSNRHGFNHFLQSHLAQGPIALWMLDLDQFKSVNDAHGHGVGDQLLVAVSARLRAMVDGPQCLARLGGDEFALAVPGLASAALLRARGEALQQALRQPFNLGDLHLEVHASVGAASVPEHASDAADLLSAADMALYAAKAAGRDALRVYDPEVGHRVRLRARVTHELAQALARDELRLDYQLVFDANSCEPVAAESLLRWTHPQRGDISPMTFVPLAEETGQILPIGIWALRRACQDAMTWPRPLTVAVNLSAVQLRSRDLVAQVGAILADTGLPAQRLELELTETALAAQDVIVAEALMQLRALGVRLALDDFGTGFSSLSYLRRFGFDRLKIDRSFVQPLRGEAPAQAVALLRAIVGLADALGLACTAEGVEHEEQRHVLQHMGCGQLQGFLLMRPVAAAELVRVLAEQDFVRT